MKNYLNLLTVITLLLGSLLFYSCPPQTVQNSRTATPNSIEVESKILGVVDGRVLVNTYAGNKEVGKRIKKWVVESGQAEIKQDPFTGETLFKPAINSEPVVVKPIFNDDSEGKAISIGMSPESLPLVEREILRAGGGACPQRWADGVNALLAGPVDVRSVIHSSVIPLTKTERLLVHNHAQYYAYDKKGGPMKLTLSKDLQSFTKLTSKGRSSGFFPAHSETHLYIDIEFLNMGVTMYNKEPMILEAEETEWLVFDTPQTNETPVAFYSKDNPDEMQFEVIGQEQYLYPSEELEFLSKDFRINKSGKMDVRFAIKNNSDKEAHVRWFAIGHTGDSEKPLEGKVLIPPGETIKTQFNTQVNKASYTRFLTLGAVTDEGQRMSGFATMDYNFPGK